VLRRVATSVFAEFRVPIDAGGQHLVTSKMISLVAAIVTAAR
jgi:hypothetical protein